MTPNFCGVKSEKEIIDFAADFDMSKVVRRYCKDHGTTPEIGERYERELKRYLTLCALHPAANYGMRGPVDELWHTFVFFTKEYFAFCEGTGGRYIHHVPEDDSEAGNWVGKKSNYPKMIKAYRLVFGEDPPADVWPAFKRTVKTDGVAEDAMADDACVAACGNRCSGSCNTCGGGGTSCNGGCNGCDTCGDR